MKLSHPDHAAQPSEHSSGAACPGLIEASSVHGHFLNLVVTHPGLLAPASLKQKRRDQVYQRPHHSSGAACPGLIEAALPHTVCGDREPTHPGLLAPASLKHQHGLHFPTPEDTHPGLLAPASLKPNALPGCADGRDDSSGAACPGLIEASAIDLILHVALTTHPGLLAPASLKQRPCRSPAGHGVQTHPGLLAPASLKQDGGTWWVVIFASLIRGCLPRPH